MKGKITKSYNTGGRYKRHKELRPDPQTLKSKYTHSYHCSHPHLKENEAPYCYEKTQEGRGGRGSVGVEGGVPGSGVRGHTRLPAR